ncbi:MAG TPA: bifunctional oligoribonuclease/PAP phosphatase NrnA [Ktedonobacteraceae bacterium]|jgi:phosphoesterase RecJ-like protein
MVNTQRDQAHPTLSPVLAPTLVAQAMDLITPAQRIALLAHERPDGDALGSALGLAHILRQLGKTCVPACADPLPHSFQFLPASADLQNSLGDENFDLVIALDAGELSRYGALYERHRAFLDRATILNIDHHVSSNGCGLVNIIDPTAAATAELLILFQQQAGLPLTQEAALCLLTGLITDTSSFQYSNTTPRTMEAGAAMLQAGAVAETIAKPIFRTHPLSHMRFMAAVINTAQTSCNGRLIWSYATEKTVSDAGAIGNEDDNFSGMLRDIEGVQIAAFFKNYDNNQNTRLSLRSSDPYNVAEICMKWGGGGHARAAGATIPLPLAEAISYVIPILEQALSTPNA